MTYKGKSATARVVDTCESCGSSDLGECHNIDKLVSFRSLDFSPTDLSPDAFQQLAPLSQGVASPMTWEFE
jgi:hypothetical protein